MKVTFNHPLVNGSNPLNDFNPNDVNQYPTGHGIYCYGFRKEIQGKLVFIPLYVGIAENLKKRLLQHFNEEKSDGNSKWYVFDYSSLNTISDVSDLYNDMRISDSIKKLNQMRFTNKLIWFNHDSFFNFKLNQNCSSYKSDSGVQKSIMQGGDLDNIYAKYPKCNADILKDKIINAKTIFDKDFYFIYSKLDENIEIEKNHLMYENYEKYKSTNEYNVGRKNGVGKTLCERIENLTKHKLGSLGIYTAAKSHGLLIDAKIDLSAISNSLIVLMANNYTNNCYKNQLIL